MDKIPSQVCCVGWEFSDQKHSNWNKTGLLNQMNIHFSPFLFLMAHLKDAEDRDRNPQ